jgi:hypothetical protein
MARNFIVRFLTPRAFARRLIFQALIFIVSANKRLVTLSALLAATGSCGGGSYNVADANSYIQQRTDITKRFMAFNPLARKNR